VWSSLHADSSMPSSHRSTKCISVITYRARRLAIFDGFNQWWSWVWSIMILKYFYSLKLVSPFGRRWKYWQFFNFWMGASCDSRR
jgi:hypothetical protein